MNLNVKNPTQADDTNDWSEPKSQKLLKTFGEQAEKGSKKCLDFMSKVLTMDPKRRVSAAMAYYHQFLRTEPPLPCANAEIRVDKKSNCHEMRAAQMHRQKKEQREREEQLRGVDLNNIVGQHQR